MKYKTLIGIDPSLKSTGYYVQDENGNMFDYGTFEGTFENVINFITQCYREYYKPLFIIEGYAFAATGQRLLQQAELIGVLKFAIESYSLQHDTMQIQTWKKLTGVRLKKGTKKLNNAYCEFVNDKYDIMFTKTDEADAFLLVKAWEIKNGVTYE